jgi:hypothetical protein
VLQAGAGNPWLDRALYMQGWSRYRQGRWNDALESLFGVLDLKLAAGTPQPLPRAEQELVDDSLRVTALALEQLQGAAAIDAHVQGERRRGYAWRVYEQLAALYQRQGRMRDAGDTWQRLAQAAAAVAAAAWARLQVVAVAGCRRLHAAGAAGAARLRAGPCARQRLGACAGHGRQRRQHRLAAAGDLLAQPPPRPGQRTKQADEVDAALRWYRLAIATRRARPGQRPAPLPDGRAADRRRPRRRRAGRLRAGGLRARRRRARTGRRADAAYAALLAREPAAGPPEAAAPGDQQLAAAQRFASAFDTDARARRRAGATRPSCSGRWPTGPAARTLAQQVLQRPDAAADTRRRAHAVLGDVALRSGTPAPPSRPTHRSWRCCRPDDTARAATRGDRLAAAIYRQAEADRAAGRRPMPRATSPAWPAGAEQQRRAGRAVRRRAAAHRAEGLGRRHAGAGGAAQPPPAAPSWPPTPCRSWRWPTPRAAARATRRRSWNVGPRRCPMPDAARAARWQAAGLYDRAGDSARALAVIWQRVQQDPASPLPQVVQSRWRLAEQARAASRGRDEQPWLRSLRQADAAGGSARTEATRTLSARAALRLAEPLLQAYRQVALVEPLKTSLARKQARFDAVQAAYADAAATGSAAGQALATAASADLYPTSAAPCWRRNARAG